MEGMIGAVHPIYMKHVPKTKRGIQMHPVNQTQPNPTRRETQPYPTTQLELELSVNW